MKMKTKNNHGGRRPGAGNPGKPRVEERRKAVTLTILPSVLAPFRKKYGRGWARRVEELIRSDRDPAIRCDREPADVKNVATRHSKPHQ